VATFLQIAEKPWLLHGVPGMYERKCYFWYGGSFKIAEIEGCSLFPFLDKQLLFHFLVYQKK